MKSRAERYLDRLVELVGREPQRVYPIESSRPDVHLPPVAAFSFPDTPEPGLITGFTYGLSLARHPLWKFGRPELAVTVYSSDPGWPISIGLMAERLRGDCPFEYGNTIRVGEPITDETHMTGFVIFAPAFPREKDADRIDIGEDLPIGLSGCYPVHESEMDFIGRRGLEEFWKLDWDAYDVERGPVVFD